MPEQSFDVKFIALAQLETGLRLFQDQSELFSVVTLAGVAEGILGKLLTARAIDNSLESLKKSAAAMHEHLFGEWVDPRVFAYRANKARNRLKHLGDEPEQPVSINVREEAIDMLNRAIDNYWLLEQHLTPAMAAFERSQRVV